MMERFLNQAANDELHKEPADVALALRNLTAGYNGRVAIKGLTGDFTKGSATAVIGPNGAGKSTLLKVVAGQVRAMAGDVACKKARVAFLPQQAEVDRSFPINVRDMVGFGLLHRTGPIFGPNRKLRSQIEEALQAVSLEGFGDRPISALSGGQFQRTLFARLLLQDADIILLDEPFSGIDTPTIDVLLAFLPRWRAEGRTIIAALHDMAQVRAAFATTLLLSREVVAWGPTAQVITPENLGRASMMLDRWGTGA